MTNSVTRYRPYYFDPRNLTGHPATMRENAEGDYVRFEDYERLRKLWEDACKRMSADEPKADCPHMERHLVCDSCGVDMRTLAKMG